MHGKPLKALVFPAVLICVTLFSTHVQGMDFHQIFDAGPPQVTHEGVLFTYKPGAVMPRYVMVSGSFDNWRTAHMMTRNEYGIFSYLYNEEGKKGVILDVHTYQYRYLVDGVWITDPLNSATEYDRYGTPLSAFRVEQPIMKRQKNPIHVDDNIYVFYFDDPYARQVFLVGDFNNWNPYSHPFKRNRDGLWEIEIDLAEGDYSYRFIVDGQHTVDPLGRNIRYDRFDRELTRLRIPLERMEEEEKPGVLSLVLE
jgi:1,4-alpha-glucan branching enzyme